MNQERIGKFIAECRKAKKITQAALGEKLGVTEKSISNWENGRNMPDLSLFEPLCKELDITINELLSGEKITKEKYPQKSEENIINTLTYTNQKLKLRNNQIGGLVIFISIFIVFSAMTIFPSESSWGSIYAIIGVLISLLGLSKFTKKLSFLPRLLCHLIYFTLFIVALLVIDYISVITIKQAPRFSYKKVTTDTCIAYYAPLYNVYRLNRNTVNEYYIIDTKNEYTLDNVPNIPFNRERTGIENIKKYQNKYLGHNSNTGNLINSLPLSEYGYTFEIKQTNLIINYHTTDWYINENHYLEKSLIYNTISIFYLIENVENITFNFSSHTYSISREMIEDKYANYSQIKDDKTFNKYLEDKINDESFIVTSFKELFIDNQ